MAEINARLEQKIQTKLEEAIDQDLDAQELERLEHKITTIRKLAASE